MQLDRARLSALVTGHPDAALVAVATRDPDGRIRDFDVELANPAAAADLQGEQSLRRAMDVAGAGDLYAAIVATVESGEPLDRPTVAFHRGQEVVYRDVHAHRICPDELVVLHRDVTERVRAARALAEEQERFRMAFEDAPVGMAVASLDPAMPGRYLMVNEAFARLTGYSREQMIGMSFRELTHPDDRDEDAAQSQELVTGQRVLYRREKRMVRADGEVIWVRMSATPVRVEGPPTYVIGHVEDITARRLAEAELVRRALYDPVTDLPNRALLLDRCAQAIRALPRTGGCLAVLFLDLDRFKGINDTLGHDAGDQVLVEVARRITGCLRGNDVAARLAGDEFVVVASLAGPLDAAHIAERLRAAVTRPMRVEGRDIEVELSIGITTAADESFSAEELLRRADLAMYQAKRHGARPWELYDDALHRAALQRLTVEQDLRQALSDGWLRLHYQPIVDLRENKIVSVEALLRIEHPHRGLSGPASFIDVAEDSNLIVPIGEWVLAEACEQLAQWQRLQPGMQVSVNVSARQARHLIVTEHVMAAVRRARISPSDITVEITERVLVDASDQVVADLQALAAAGCGLAIDDFGTGYSSLTYLKRFPVTGVKIDRSFVAGLGQRHDDTAIVEAVTALARTLDLTTVAEGVESHPQLQRLRELGCQRAQGYLLGLPSTASQITELLRA